MSLGEITSLGQWAVVSLMASGWSGEEACRDFGGSYYL
jgi:hypothetical protein